MDNADAPAPDPASLPSPPAFDWWFPTPPDDLLSQLHDSICAARKTRRICWPNPDATCLQGGCGYCQHEKPRAVSVIERYARKAGTLPNRCGDKRADALEAFQYGEAREAGR